MSDDIGYHYCSCHDCFELYVGKPGEMCNECDDAGCDGDDMCQTRDWEDEA